MINIVMCLAAFLFAFNPAAAEISISLGKTPTSGVTIDLTDLDVFADRMPHDWFDLLRREAPVWRSRGRS